MNPFREMLNGAMPQTGRNIPILLNPIAPMSGTDQVLADGNDSAVKLLTELAARKQAFEEMLKGRIDSPQMQMPNVQPNKNVALLGGLAALIGALTGDKYAVPAFGQLAGGLQQDAQAKAQRLLQEQQMKMQSQAQKDKAIGDLLGFQLEDAQNAYSRANASDAANRKAKAESEADAVKRAFEVWKTTSEIQGRQDLAGINNASREKMAWLRGRGKAAEVESLMNDIGLSQEDAINSVYKTEVEKARQELLQAQAATTKDKPKLAREQMDAAQKRAETMAQSGERRTQMQQEGAMSRAQYTQGQINARNSGQKVSYKFEDDPSWYSFEKRMKDLDLESMAHDLKNIQYAADLKKAEGFPDGPQKQQLIKFYNEQIDIRTRRMSEIQAKRIAIRAEQLKREAEIMTAKQTGAGTVRGVGSSPPRMSGSLKPSGAGTVAPINPMNLPGVQFKPAPSKGKRPLGIFKPR